MQTLQARRLVTADTVLDYALVRVDGDGRIAEIGSDPSAFTAEQAAANDLLCAGFLDVHTHGACGHDVMSAPPAALAEMQRFLASRGVAHYLPTTVTNRIDPTLRALDALATAIEHAAARPPRGEAIPVGIHLEGPFLSHAKRGVHPPDCLQPPDIGLFTRYWEAARGHIRLLTVAPELPGADALIAHAASLGVRASLGHTDARAAEMLRGIDAGASSATHTFNAMRGLDHREPGALGVVLDDPRLFAELICDGVHVAPAAVRLWWKAKGPERAILITDAMAAAGMPEGEYALGALRVHVADGRALLAEDLRNGKETLAGSVLTMDRAVHILTRYTQDDLAAISLAATHTPAAMLGQPQLTELRAGAWCNLNHLNADGSLRASWLRGVPVATA